MRNTHPDTAVVTGVPRIPTIPEPRAAEQPVPVLPWSADAEQTRVDAAEHRADAAERRIEAVERALTTRAGIDQAKGAIMAVFALSADSAFEVLVWVSQHANVELAVVADRFLAEMHVLDLDQRPREQLTGVLATLAGHDPTSPGRPGGVPA